MVKRRRTSAQKEGRSAGQRQKRQLRQAKRKDERNNVWRIRASVSNTPDASQFDSSPVYGIYRNEGDWVLTIMSCVRKEEVNSGPTVRQPTVSLVRGRYILSPNSNPREGLPVENFSKKKKAMNKIRAGSSTRRDSGEYLVFPGDNPTSRAWKVDRDKYADWKRQSAVVRVYREDDQTSRY